MLKLKSKLARLLIITLVMQFIVPIGYTPFRIALPTYAESSVVDAVYGDETTMNVPPPSGDGHGIGLMGEYFNDESLTDAIVTRIDDQVAFNWNQSTPAAGVDPNHFSVRWTGQIEPIFTETYTIHAEAHGGLRLWVDNQLMFDAWDKHNQIARQGTIDLEGGKRYDIQLEYRESNGTSRVKLLWESASQGKSIIPQSQLYPIGVPSVTTAALSETSVALEWGDVRFSQGYDVEVDGAVVSNGNETSFVHDNLLPGTLHTYRVRALYGIGAGEWSQAVQKWTLPDIPSGLRASATSHSISIEWNEVVGATGYELEVYNTVEDNGAATQYTEAGLNPNTQRTYRVRAKNESGVGGWSPIIAKSTLSGTPGALTAEADDTSINVSWDAMSGAICYELEVDGEVVSDITGTHYLHNGLQPNSTHQYRVRSKNTEGASGWSGIVSAVTLPSIPQHVRTEAAIWQIAVAWDTVAGATGYDIEADGVVLDSGNATTYVHAGLESLSEHTYRVRAKNGSVVGKWSELITRSTLSSVPANLRTETTSREITLTWDVVIGATRYDVEADGVVKNNGLGTTYVHSGLSPYTEHKYRVRAISAGGTGEWSEYVLATTGLDTPEIELTAVSTSEISVSWSAVSGATGYDLMIDGELIDVGTVTSYVHRELSPYSWHAYRVRARSGAHIGSWSETLTQATLLGTPTIVKLDGTSSQITVQWDEVEGATGYEIEADGAIVDVGSSTVYVHRNLIPNTSHTYRVRANNGSAISNWSSWSKTVTKSTPPAAPQNLRAMAGTESMTLMWDASPGSSSYELEIDNRKVGGVVGTSYIHPGLKPNTMHNYRIRATNASGNSPWSDWITAQTIPEMTVNVNQDTIFNFVVVAPKKPGKTERQITVTYNPDELEVLDLSAATPEREQKAGPIIGTNLTVISVADGKIVYSITGSDKTVVNIIQFVSKTNEQSKIAYTFE